MKIKSLIDTLKVALKQKNIGYKKVAEALNLSESSVKRLFAEQGFTLSRLEKTCELAGIDFCELVRLHESERGKLSQLSIKQEQQLVKKPILLLICICLSAEMSLDDIGVKYDIKINELVMCFAQLDRLGVIDFLPLNRYRLNVSKNFAWIPNGPIHRFVTRSVLSNYLQQSLSRKSSHLLVKWGMLSESSATEMLSKLQRLTEDYVELEEQDIRLPLEQKATSSLFVLFSERWNEQDFKSLWTDPHQLKPEND